MKNTYSYFYIGTKTAHTALAQAKEISLGFLQDAIKQKSSAVSIQIHDNPLLQSIVLVTFGETRVSILNCTRPLSIKKTKNSNNELAMLKHKYTQFISDFYEGGAPRAMYAPDTCTEQDVSQFFRGSNTLKFQDCDTYKTEDVTLSITELGFAMRYEVQHQMNRETRYYRLLILQALILSYEQRMGKMTSRMVEMLSGSHDYEDVLTLRDNIALFNATFYFHYPVNYKQHEVYGFHRLMVKKMNIKQINEELASNTKALEEISNIENERKEQKFHRLAAIIGGVIALFSVYDVVVK